MNIYLVRHGEATASWQESDDPGLSERGHQQAAETAGQLQEQVEPRVRLISSPMLRARETAQPLAQALGAEVSVVEAFREIPTPVPRAERQTWLATIAQQDWIEQHHMVRDWRRALLARLRQFREPTVVFTHFMVLNAIVGALTAENKVVCFMPDNASVTILEGSGSALRLVELGRQFKTVVH